MNIKGFIDVRHIRASLLLDDLQHLRDWLDKGYNGQMSFLTRDPARRCDPRKIMPSCKTVIIAATRYNDMPKSVDTHLIPELSVCPRYLQHEDYHVIMMEKLESIVSELKKEHPDAEFKCYVDTGPILEKAWAASAGIGFIGKNTLLISPTHGSQLALGVVLTSVSLQGSEATEAISRTQLNSGDCFARPWRTHNDNVGCGSCTACIDACPSGALVKPYTLDARKCISYKFFIEKKDGGCDICQNACPYNNLNQEAGGKKQET
ncbi:MAG: hypothetical protein COV46_08495 [Deltaproteobacteria bacterium CG11_big_fil_rev_8_21_14_0_20_49_13]|nr:MAG: hypothetical protein COV46_08495 [Deltaproteobacteria bacterium CG11_big_fil_rev_8_21_14_0_20_49_13]